MIRAKGDPIAVVVGPVDHVRPLSRAGVRCHVMAPPGAIVRYSRHVAGRIPWADPLLDPAGFVALLMAFAEDRPEPPVLFCGGDFDLLAISRARQTLTTRYRFVLADPDLVEDLVDKRRFLDLSERLGLPTPRTALVGAGTTSRVATALRFPVVVKPVTRDDARWGAMAAGAKVLEIGSTAELDAALERFDSAGIDVLVQEVVPGPEERVVSYHVYVDPGGSRVAEFTGRKVRTHPLAYGHSTALEVVDLPQVRDLGRDIVARLGLVGVAKLDLKEDPDGRLRLLEVNPRFTLWNHPAALAGINLPALVYADLSGQPRPPIGPLRSGVRWCDPLTDAHAAVEHGMGLLDWLGWFVSAEAKAAFDPTDPGPLLLGGAWRLRRRLRGVAPDDRPTARSA